MIYVYEIAPPKKVILEFHPFFNPDQMDRKEESEELEDKCRQVYDPIAGEFDPQKEESDRPPGM